jgi:hypothetical protein
MMYTGDPDATDPVCSLSPKRGLIDAVIADVAMPNTSKWVYRINPSNVVTEPRAATEPRA